MDKYVKGAILGTGTFGSVYKATTKEVRPLGSSSPPLTHPTALHVSSGQSIW